MQNMQNIDVSLLFCILFCILLHIYVKNVNMQNIQNLKICKNNSAVFIFIWNHDSDRLYVLISYRYVLSTSRYVPCYSMVPT